MLDFKLQDLMARNFEAHTLLFAVCGRLKLGAMKRRAP
jgi:hypothetical protein